MADWENPLLKAALEYLAAGRSVVPLANKKPTRKWKELQNRLATPEEARAWFSGRGGPSQLAMIMGQVSGRIWVMDADGFAAVDWLEHNAPPTTVYVRTKRGRHAYYRMPPGVEVRNGNNVVPDLKKSTGHQLDVRGEGGYVVVPPSSFTGGAYSWDIREGGWEALTVWQPPVASSPSVLLPGPGNLNLDLSDVQLESPDYSPRGEGERNNTLARMAGGMIARGVPVEEVLFCARGWNLDNRPPLPEGEVRRTVESIAQTHLRNHGSLPAPLIILPTSPVPPSSAEAGDVPPGLLKPGGVLEQIMNYIEQSTVASFPLFSLGAALAMVGALVGQKIATETGLRTNIYVFCLAASGTGKNAPITAGRKLLLESGEAADYLGPSHLASAAALVRELHERDNLSRSRSMILFIDEIGDIIGAAKNKSNLAKSELIQTLKELYSATNGIYIKAYADNKYNLTINNPHLSFYATGVPRRFWENLTSGDIADGFLPRAMVFSVDIPIKKKRKPSQVEPPESLVQAIRSLATADRNFVGNMERTSRPRVVAKTPEAEALFDQWDDEMLKLQNSFRGAEDGRGEIYNRAAEQVHKIALIHAVSLAGGIPDAVALESVRYAVALVEWYVPRMVGHIVENISAGEFDDLRKRILRIVDKRGSVTKRDVYKNLHGCTVRMAEEALKVLQESGDLVQAQTTKNNGRVCLIWAKPQEGEENE